MKPQISWDEHEDGVAPTSGTVHTPGRTLGNITHTGSGWQAWSPCRMNFTGPVTPGELVGVYESALAARDALAARK